MKEDDIVLLHDIVLSMLGHAVLYSDLLFIFILNPVFYFADFGTNELGLKL